MSTININVYSFLYILFIVFMSNTGSSYAKNLGTVKKESQEVTLMTKNIGNSLFSAELKRCNSINCSKEKGICVGDNICRCNKGFVEFKIKRNSKYERSHCSYIQKRSLVAFALEAIIPLGIGHLYCENYLLFFLKFFVVALLPLLYIVIASYYKEGAFSQKNENIFSITWCIVCGLIYIIDIFCYATERYTDGNNIPLVPL